MKRQSLSLPDGETAEVEIEFDHRKTIRIRVHPGGRVTVSAPRSAGMAPVKHALESRRNWISRHLRKLRDNPGMPAVFEEGAIHFHLGNPCPMNIRRAERSGVSMEAGVLILHSTTPEDPEQLKKVFRKWMRSEAERILTERLSFWKTRIPGLPDYRFRLRWMRSRWGSCSHSNSIVFNTQLVKAPLSCIDYVVVHELCHTLHHNHGSGFKRLLTSVLPDWKAAVDHLKNMPVLL